MTIAIYVNQIGFDRLGPKMAVVASELSIPPGVSFSVVNESTGDLDFVGTLGKPQAVMDWDLGKWFNRADLTGLRKSGTFRILISVNGERYYSSTFQIGDDALARLTVPAIVDYYRKQRADTTQELAADSVLRLKGSDKTVDMRGGWCDAGGDVSKYLSHLSYANFMSPQQTPLVIWSLATVRETLSERLGDWGIAESLPSEALWGADYLVRSLSSEGFFRGIVFSYFKKDPSEREIVGLLADSVTTQDYQAAYREGGGMAIAALARVSRWNLDGDYKAAEYLAAAERAFEHLQIHNLEYDDDGIENIIDDYCALLGATELWMATGDDRYRDEARKRSANLSRRMTPAGYFLADDGDRPFWHASDAGLPVIALARYLEIETDEALRSRALATIKAALDYHLAITNRVGNPFGYPRQTFRVSGAIQEGFFIPHENETGWWWQGENARLGSLAAAAITGGRLVYPGSGRWGVAPELAEFASRQLSWILGCNPYDMCFMYGFGLNNVPHMDSMFGHGSEAGGISNGITGKDGRADGTGIDFKLEAGGNEWRWTEQWIPHAAWFLQAVAATAVAQREAGHNSGV